MNPIDDTLPASTVSASAPPARSGDIPATIGRFAVDTKLGEGGMGVVLLATDPLLGRKVAIKVLRGAAIDDSAKRRLLREAQATAQLSHENVIVVHEVGTHDEQVFLAMEYVAGETLRRRQANRPWREILELYASAGRGLQAAHDAGLVHRDFKPDNVLVGTDGRLRVTDFGLVAATGTSPEPVTNSSQRGESELSSKLTQTGAIMGTPRYMAPEQHRGEAVDARADQFAFCVSLYEALYGQMPFAGTTYSVLAASVLAGTLIAPPASSDVPPPVRDAVLRGLRTDRNDRHLSIRELIPLLAVVAPRRRWPFAVGIAGAVLALAVAAVVINRGDAVPPARRDVEAPTSRLDLATLGPALRAFDEGDMNFRAGIYAEAVKNFEAGYVALKAPQFLYNTGVSLFMLARRDGDPVLYRRAVVLYKRYLDTDPIAVADAIAAINVEAARLEAGGDRHTPSPAIAAMTPQLRGFVLVNSEPPGATVYLDDPAKGPVGTTPWAGTLDGQHVIYLGKPGYAQFKNTLSAERNRFKVLQAVLTRTP